MKVQQIINLLQIGCATDSCAKVQQIMHMQCRGCAFVWCPVIADVLVQCVRVVRENCVKVQCMACYVSGSVM